MKITDFPIDSIVQGKMILFQTDEPARKSKRDRTFYICITNR
uniref:Uncharacterized protein n=1 Tax=Candidatus Kentrum sp. TUN TaxID=2126343 RepID=A0A450ZBF0_9GAMM|nr:MAG: hypothetical protein BECKTUN1418D_GA0071000_100517 [Candidatus Kentron sp. TUN]